MLECLKVLLKLSLVFLLLILLYFLFNFFDTHTTCYDYVTLDNEIGTICENDKPHGSCSNFYGNMRCTIDKKRFQVKEYTWYIKNK